jgi:hypothetical protein
MANVIYLFIHFTAQDGLGPWDADLQLSSMAASWASLPEVQPRSDMWLHAIITCKPGGRMLCIILCCRLHISKMNAFFKNECQKTMGCVFE